MNLPANTQFWDQLRRHTPARIGLNRAGDALSTRDVLDAESAHAQARDAVHTTLDVETVADRLRLLGLGDAATVASRAANREQYLRRPDLGRQPDPRSNPVVAPADIALVLADGLSPRGVNRHGATLAAAVYEQLSGRYSLGVPVIATQARVALGDHVGQWLDALVVIVIIGERPGLSVSESLGAYLTYRPRPGRLDSERNCVSNIHPDGLDFIAAARTIAALTGEAIRRGVSGVSVKNTFTDNPAPPSIVPAPIVPATQPLAPGVAPPPINNPT